MKAEGEQDFDVGDALNVTGL